MDLLNIIRVKLQKYPHVRKILFPFHKMIRKYDISRLNKAYQKYGLEVFHVFCRTLNTKSISFWPEFGTLLGVFREGDFIKHDNDFDFGAFVSDREKIVDSLVSNGFKLISSYGCDKLDYVREDTFSYKGVHLDIFYFHETEKNDICYTFIPSEISNGTNLLYKIKVFVFDKIVLKEIQFKDEKVFIPFDTASHLIVSYGPNFMKPDPNFKSINYTFLADYLAYHKTY